MKEEIKSISRLEMGQSIIVPTSDNSEIWKITRVIKGLKYEEIRTRESFIVPVNN